MSEFLKYVVLAIFLLVVIAIIWILRDGISVRNGGSFSLRRAHTIGCLGPTSARLTIETIQEA